MSPGYENKHLKAGDPKPALQKGSLRMYSMRFCPYSQRVHLVLDAKKVKYDIVNVDLHKKPEWIFQLTPNGGVPVLEFENGDSISESIILADMLDEMYPDPPLHPKDPVQKAKDKILLDRFSKVATKFFVLLTQGFKTEDMDELKNGLDLFEKEIVTRGTPYFGGSQPGMLDLMIWPWCERVSILRKLGGDEFQVPVDRFPKLQEWRARMKTHEAVTPSYIDTPTHTKFFKSRTASEADYDIMAKH